MFLKFTASSSVHIYMLGVSIRELLQTLLRPIPCSQGWCEQSWVAALPIPWEGAFPPSATFLVMVWHVWVILPEAHRSSEYVGFFVGGFGSPSLFDNGATDFTSRLRRPCVWPRCLLWLSFCLLLGSNWLAHSPAFQHDYQKKQKKTSFFFKKHKLVAFECFDT